MSVDTLANALTHPRLTAIPAFADNVIWAVTDAARRHCLLVDPGDAGPVRDWLTREGLALAAILVTHHHGDHTGGIAALRGPGVAVYGPRAEPIAGVDHPVGEGSTVDVPSLALQFTVLDVPGHTAGHVAYHGVVDGTPLLFCGDTLFSAGCGRLFEGSAAQLHDSLSRLAALPPDTLVCCAHEYTLGNLRFAAAVEPDNPDVARMTAWATARRARGLPTLPGDLARERRVNPFLRTGEPAVAAAIARHAGQVPESDAAAFGVLRRWKDGFR